MKENARAHFSGPLRWRRHKAGAASRAALSWACWEAAGLVMASCDETQPLRWHCRCCDRRPHRRRGVDRWPLQGLTRRHYFIRNPHTGALGARVAFAGCCHVRSTRCLAIKCLALRTGFGCQCLSIVGGHSKHRGQGASSYWPVLDRLLYPRPYTR